MVNFYAQLNAENIVVCISSLSGEVDSQQMIEIEFEDISLLGKKYENGTFIETQSTSQIEAILTTEELTEELLLETKYQTALIELMG